MPISLAEQRIVRDTIREVHRSRVRLSDSAQSELHRSVRASLRERPVPAAEATVTWARVSAIAGAILGTVRAGAASHRRQVLRRASFRRAVETVLPVEVRKRAVVPPRRIRAEVPVSVRFTDLVKTRVERTEHRTLQAAGVGSYEEMYALTLQFPSIAKNPEISLPRMSNVAASTISAAARAGIASNAAAPATFSLGSAPPEDAFTGDGYRQEELPTASESLVSSSHTVECALATPVRDQGQRGTCVAHAVVACSEEHFRHDDLSEQHLYWGAKIRGGDPHPSDEGTLLRCARNALQREGVCDEGKWPYNPVPLPGNESQEIAGVHPSAAAAADGRGRLHSAAVYQDVAARSAGKARLLLAEVERGAVAVSLPVFFDPLTQVSNWGWSQALRYGHVLDPTQFSVVGGGHAVCVCGFMPSEAAPGGGWFVFKNSWSTLRWSDQKESAPEGHPRVPAGYGYLSASYVDKFLWELLRL
ncbi:MAG TPA: C1 family peptidase [Longimicrobium sp.]|jgi:hypothetical protein